ncbi:MAG: dUTP diphosphatase [Flavobacteriales bacterium]|nr:dUTP diphosphatase [Flavobacteriales bacterium]|tara:strand:- start:3436 stop:3870 length:435 start_codon:yes stop_codon:yes gene_type:complete
MRIGIINNSKHQQPTHKTPGSSGVDICANIEKDIVLKPGGRTAVPTGVFLEIPMGFEIQVRPRSGLALKHGITVLNSPGTIDSDYRGEILVILVNHSRDPFVIQNGDRVAQLVLAKVEKITWHNIDNLTKTQRGTGGFGSTGKK